MLGLALIPAALAVLTRRWWVGAIALVVCAAPAIGVAFDVPVTEMRPGERDFFGPAFGGIADGFRDLWETDAPFSISRHPELAGLVLLGDLRAGRRHRPAHRSGPGASGRSRTRHRGRSTRHDLCELRHRQPVAHRCDRARRAPRPPLPDGERAAAAQRRRSGRGTRDRRRAGRCRRIGDECCLEGRVPLLEGLGSVRPTDRPGRCPLRLELELQRSHVPEEGDRRPDDQGAEHVVLLACDDTRRVHGRRLAREHHSRPGAPDGRSRGRRSATRLFRRPRRSRATGPGKT